MNNSILFLKKFWPVLCIFFLWIAFSFPYFFHHNVPFPSTFLVNAYSPWSRYGLYASPIKNSAMPDLIDQIYPWKYFSLEQLKSGSLPFWNPYSFSGTPHIANYQTAVFSPATLLYFILPFIDAWSLTILLQPLLTGIFTYLYMRKLAVSQPGSLIGSVAFMFSGFLVVWMAYGTLGMAVAPLPLLLYCIELYFENKKVKLALIGTSLSLTFSFLSGHFQTSIYVFGVSALYVLYKAYISSFNKAVLPVLYLIVGLLLAMPQLLPSLEFFQNAPRSVAQVASAGIPFYNLVTIIAPDFFGNPVTRNNLFLDFAEWQTFIGATAFLLSVFAIHFSKKRNISVFFFVIGFFALILSINSPLQVLVASLHIPVLSTSTQSRIIIIFAFCFSILAGLGHDQVLVSIKNKNYKQLVLRTGIVLICLFAIWVVLQFGKFLDPEHTQIAKKNFILPSVFLLIGSVSIIVATKIKKQFLPLFSLVIICLVSFESFRFASKWMPFDPANLVFPQAKITDIIKKDIGTGRIYGNMGQQMTMYYGLPSIEGYDPLYIQRYGELVVSQKTGTFTPTGGRAVFVDKTDKNTDRLLNILGVNLIFHPVSDTNASWAYPVWQKSWMKSIFTDGVYTIYKNEQALPRMKMFYTVRSSSDGKEIIKTFYDSNFDYEHIVLLEEKNPIHNTKLTKNNVNITNFKPNSIEATVFTDQEGMLFLSNPFYPGWKAFVDGKETKIYRADYALQAIKIPVGTHKVSFSYFPMSFVVGLFLSVLGLLFLPSFLLLRKRF